MPCGFTARRGSMNGCCTPRQPERLGRTRSRARQRVHARWAPGGEHRAGRFAAHVGPMKAILIAVLVIGGVVGLLLTLRTSRNTGMPSPETLARAKERERERAADDADD